MSDTPRTDSYVYKFPGCQREPRLIDFARQLERELAEAQDEVERLKEYTTCTLVSIDAEMDDKDVEIAERDKLIEQMRVELKGFVDIMKILTRNSDKTSSNEFTNAMITCIGRNELIINAALSAAERGDK